MIGRGYAWLDTGTHDSLLEASQFIATLERDKALRSPARRRLHFATGWIDAAQLETLAQPLMKNSYGQYLLKVLKE